MLSGFSLSAVYFWRRACNVWGTFVRVDNNVDPADSKWSSTSYNDFYFLPRHRRLRRLRPRPHHPHLPHFVLLRRISSWSEFRPACRRSRNSRTRTTRKCRRRRHLMTFSPTVIIVTILLEFWCRFLRNLERFWNLSLQHPFHFIIFDKDRPFRVVKDSFKQHIL